MQITADIFEAYLNCPTKAFLRAHNEAGTENAYADLGRMENEAYRSVGIKRLVESAAPDECLTGLAGIKELKTVQWQIAVEVLAQARDLESRIHAIVRMAPEGRGKAAQFIPVRFINRNKLATDNKLLLTFDALVLSEMLGRPVKIGKLIHGDDHATIKVKIPTLRNRVGKLSEKIAALLSVDTPPDLVLNRHCGECEFRTRCRLRAVEKDDLSLLSGISEKEREKLNSKGIFTVTQLSYTFRPRRRPRRLRNKREKYYPSLRALAIREKKIHVVGNSELKIEGTPVYLDVEGLPDCDFYYLIGVRGQIDGTVCLQSMWADSKEDEKRIWTEFLTVLKEIENPVLIHYGHYETTFLKQMHDRYGGPPEDSAVAKALKSPINLLNVIFAQVYFPTYTNGLKDVAGSMGFTGQTPSLQAFNLLCGASRGSNHEIPLPSKLWFGTMPKTAKP